MNWRKIGTAAAKEWRYLSFLVALLVGIWKAVPILTQAHQCAPVLWRIVDVLDSLNFQRHVGDSALQAELTSIKIQVDSLSQSRHHWQARRDSLIAAGVIPAYQPLDLLGLKQK